MKPFWEQVPLKDMTPEQWESLCDHCGLCCLKKIIYEKPLEVAYTNVACRLLDIQTCQCSNYKKRFSLQPECVSIELKHLRKPQLMPRSCAYLRVYEGRGLPEWHPLVSGNPESVHLAGITLKGEMISELEVHEDDLDDYVLPDSKMPN